MNVIIVSVFQSHSVPVLEIFRKLQPIETIILHQKSKFRIFFIREFIVFIREFFFRDAYLAFSHLTVIFSFSVNFIVSATLFQFWLYSSDRYKMSLSISFECSPFIWLDKSLWGLFIVSQYDGSWVESVNLCSISLTNEFWQERRNFTRISN